MTFYLRIVSGPRSGDDFSWRVEGEYEALDQEAAKVADCKYCFEGLTATWSPVALLLKQLLFGPTILPFFPHFLSL